MADLVTHIAVAHILKRLSARPGHPLLFSLGTSLPDLLGRAPGLTLAALEYTFGDLAVNTAIGLEALHTPIPYLVGCLFAAWCTRADFRRTLFWNLLLGGYLHLLVDFTQTHLEGGYLLLFPFSWRDYELGWIGTEDSLYAAPFLVVAAALVEWRYRRRNRSTQSATHEPAIDPDIRA